MTKISLVLLVLFCVQPVSAEEQTKKQNRDAVKAVQKEMRDPNFANKAQDLSPEAKAVAERVKTLAGSPEQEAQIYSLAADILGNMQDMPPDQMEKLMSKAQNDPQGFVDSWTPEQKKKLKAISERLPANQKAKTAP